MGVPILQASFNWRGFLSAMGSNLTFQSRNVFSKKIMGSAKPSDKEDKVWACMCCVGVGVCLWASSCELVWEMCVWGVLWGCVPCVRSSDKEDKVWASMCCVGVGVRMLVGIFLCIGV